MENAVARTRPLEQRQEQPLQRVRSGLECGPQRRDLRREDVRRVALLELSLVVEGAEEDRLGAALGSDLEIGIDGEGLGCGAQRIRECRDGSRRERRPGRHEQRELGVAELRRDSLDQIIGRDAAVFRRDGRCRPSR